MNHSHQEPSADEQETQSPALSKQRRFIHFSSGETLEQEDSEEEEEEEEQSDRPPFREPAERTRLSFKSVALLVGRISMLTCDFLGERLAGALGLNAAKYQYAIDQHQRDQKTTSSQAEDDPVQGAKGWSRYGAAGGPAGCQASGDEKHMERSQGRHNRAYQADDDCFK
ncbi:protein FAM177A1 [Pungitius pungitius]|uniref:protein FAM177A1 n=1 Tax=Pungitius pungitius TaxID=134920 RepID=UPI002E13367D